MWTYKTVSFKEAMYWRNGKLVMVQPANDSRITADKETPMEEVLNKIGEDGWELFWMSDDSRRFIFKKKVVKRASKKAKSVN